ncbi:unnamed protein product [Effrenium voratum]|nr:unnamed protein product [Effrenium voratum]
MAAALPANSEGEAERGERGADPIAARLSLRSRVSACSDGRVHAENMMPPRMPNRVATPQDSDSNSESSEDEAPVKPGSGSGHPLTGLLNRTSSNLSPNVSDFHRVLASLAAFRTELANSQKATLKLLDEELEKVKRSPGMGPVALARGNSGFGRKSTFSNAEAVPRAHGSEGLKEAEKEVKRFSFSSHFAILPTVQRARKRRMSWIQKTTQFTPEETSPNQSDLDAQADVSWGKEQKDKARKEADDYKKGGLLTQLNDETARETVRRRAAYELEEQAAQAAQAAQQAAEMQQPTVNTDSFMAKIAMHPYFERLTMAMIFLNAVWISVDIEFNDADILSEADPGFIVVENLFCSFFLVELILRFSMYVRTWYALTDPWYMFDVFLATLMIFETWMVPLAAAMTQGNQDSITGGASVLRVARVLRVLRTARMARLVRLMPELMILIKGMMVACRSVFFTLVLLLLFTYVFSVAFVQFSRGTALENKLFSSMGTAIWTLIMKCILTDQQPIVEAVAEESWIMAMMLLVFILFGSLTVMNMLLGVLVEAIKTVSTIEREQLEVDFAKKCLWEMIDKGHADEDGDNRISEQEYRNVLRTPQAMTALTSLGVDVEAALDYGRLLFEDGEPLTFGDFMRGILTLRGSNQTTVKDIVDLRKFTADEFSHIHEVLSGICKFLVAGHAASQPQPSQPTARTSLRSSFASWTVTEESSMGSDRT